MKEVLPSEADAKIASKVFENKKQSEGGRVKSVRTYRADVEELITKKKVTRTHIAIAEEERRRAIGESSVWEGHKATSIIPLVIAGLFLLVGVSVLFYDLAGKSVRLPTHDEEEHPFLVSGEKTEVVKLSLFTRDEITRSIRDIARGEKLAQGTNVRLSFRAEHDTSSLPIPIKTFLLMLEGSVPDILSRSLSPVYEGGLLSAGETKGYLIFTTTYYENSVVGLLGWEKNMARDLYTVIDPLRAELIPEPIGGTWRAQSWNGYDLRVFTTTDGRMALVYGWVEKKHLIMTGSIQVFSELAGLITKSQ